VKINDKIRSGAELARMDRERAQVEARISYVARKASVVGTEAFDVLRTEVETQITNSLEICHHADPSKEPTTIARAQGAVIALRQLLADFDLATKQMRELGKRNQTEG